MDPEKRGLTSVGIISIGAHEEKVPFVLSRLMSSTGLHLSLSESFDYSKGHTEEFTDRIESSLQKKGLRAVVFDVRVRGWPRIEPLKTAKGLSQALQEICSRQQISSSVFLSNGHLPLGNLIGKRFEIIEAEEVLRGNGPLDLTKYALEIGADLLLMTKKVGQKRDGKKILRDIIIQAGRSYSETKLSSESAAQFSMLKKMTISSDKTGYIQHLAVDAIHCLKSELSASCKDSGFALLKKTGDPIEKGENIVQVFLAKRKIEALRESKFREVFSILPDPPEFQPFILERSELRLIS